MNRLPNLPKGYCEMGFNGQVVPITEAVREAIRASQALGALDAQETSSENIFENSYELGLNPR
ncbi:hypothetical protein [Paramagnetospirillum magneticum]|uniref:hypothetical protein n=1 Tax=Paramagnetospirillum magneticum TaxID=84159 RepID=UPI0013052455|nr:hypothetical protein [Paramagnetospirillum magneticum]